MTFLTVLIVFILVQWWGSGSPLHHDAWFTRWCRWVKEQLFVKKIHPAMKLAVLLLGPVLVLYLFLEVVNNIFPGLQLLISVPVLLYCLGRGKFTGWISRYNKACESKDWPAALDSFYKMDEYGIDDNEVQFTEDQENWPALHHSMVMATAYRGFERMFVVLFWFVAFGPVGALVYRLSALILDDETTENDHDFIYFQNIVRHWLWALEWPVVRVLGLSFGLTGNFVSCMQNWQEYFLNTVLPTTNVLRHFVYGALNINDEEDLPEDSVPRLLKACVSLLSRTLILWICLLAIVTVLW